MKRASDRKTAVPALIVAALLVSAIVAFPLGCVRPDNSKTVDSKGKIKLDKHKIPYLSGYDKKASGGEQAGYCLRVYKVYWYGNRPDDFGIEYGVPPVACGGFSVGGRTGISIFLIW